MCSGSPLPFGAAELLVTVSVVVIVIVISGFVFTTPLGMIAVLF